ncbi:hypothetical protein K7X08_005275 [Anisodus acutangulus]|uniref:At4g15545-like C-terminal domain-containing protein n=1 Tax=Anisodus acutangulus TaxID=402998 RepID=A0A9Q1LV18_9SOLA|nr:hypothetical protein K7X08_005275 [Anisodus acutangulus]
MSESSSYTGLDFHLPDEILSIIPTDPYDQLDLARKITSMAIASRVTNLESEMGRLRQKLNDKDRLILNLEDKGLSETTSLPPKSEGTDKMKLSKERDNLAFTAKKLGRDLAKLETFKRQLMQSLSDDDSSQTETVDIGTYDQSVHKSYPLKEEVNGYTVHHSFSGSMDGRGSHGDAPKQASQRFSSPYITPRLTPTDTPKITSASVSPRRYSAASSAANSPPRARPKPAQTPRADGKEFFRQARSRLSYEQFSAFLANIKELNAQKQSREETLKKAEEIFGTDNQDLYLSFQGMLNRGVR